MDAWGAHSTRFRFAFDVNLSPVVLSLSVSDTRLHLNRLAQFFFRGTNRWDGSLLRTDAVWVLTNILYFLPLLLHIKTLITIITYNFEIEIILFSLTSFIHMFFFCRPVFGVFCPTHNIDLIILRSWTWHHIQVDQFWVKIKRWLKFRFWPSRMKLNIRLIFSY